MKVQKSACFPNLALFVTIMKSKHKENKTIITTFCKPIYPIKSFKMNKKVLFAVIAALVIGIAQMGFAQVSIGVRGGLNLSTFKSDNSALDFKKYPRNKCCHSN